MIHDLSQVGLWLEALGSEMYGCIIYHIGWDAPDRGHGHGLYTQNDAQTKTIKDCIIFDVFSFGIHAYTENSKINNYVFDGCVCFNAASLANGTDRNILVGGYQVAQNITVKNCMTFGSAIVNIGYNAGANNVTLTDNYFPGGIMKVKLINLAESGNYYGLKTGNRVFLRPNQYDPMRAKLVIYNEAQTNEIEVDVSAIYANGTQIQARNVQDYFSDIQTLTVIAGKITVNMKAINRTVATPIGWTARATTFPTFGCMVLEKVT